MGSAPLPPDEGLRLAALRKARILDTKAERGFDDLVTLAARICGTPISLVSLVDQDRQWFKARVGLDAQETSRETSFCAHAILDTSDVFVVPDATNDPRFFDNPLVTHDPNIRFYAGAPLESVEGQPIGTLCVIDTTPREITEDQLESLRALALLARDLLVMRANIEEMRGLIQQVKTLSGLIPICSWCRQVRNDEGYWRDVEQHIEAHSEAQFKYSACPNCVERALGTPKDKAEPN